MFLLCHPWFTTTNLSYTFPIFETSATASCGTTGSGISFTIRYFGKKSQGQRHHNDIEYQRCRDTLWDIWNRDIVLFELSPHPVTMSTRVVPFSRGSLQTCICHCYWEGGQPNSYSYNPSNSLHLCFHTWSKYHPYGILYMSSGSITEASTGSSCNSGPEDLQGWWKKLQVLK